MRIEDWQPIDMLRARACAFAAIRKGLSDQLAMLMQQYGLSPHVLSDAEAGLLAAAREEGLAGAASVLCDPDVTLLVYALYHPNEVLECVNNAMDLLRRSHARGGELWTRDLTAPVPGTLTVGLGGTVVELAVVAHHNAFLRLAVEELGVDSLALSPCLGAHSLLCLCAMADNEEAMRLLLAVYQRRGIKKQAGWTPCCQLTAAEAEARQHDP